MREVHGELHAEQHRKISLDDDVAVFIENKEDRTLVGRVIGIHWFSRIKQRTNTEHKMSIKDNM